MAAAASDFHFYSRLFTELGRTLNTYINDTASSIVVAITPVTTTLLTMYVMLWGWSMIRGVIQEPVIDGISRIVRLSLITGIALQLGYYNGLLVDMLWNSPDVLASYVAGRGETGSASYLDALMSQMYDFAGAYYYKALANSSYGIPNLFLLVVAGALWGAGIAATAYGAFLLALAKISLAVLLGIGPLFILGIIFEPTKRFFDAWLGQALNYVFLVMLSAATIKLILTILSTYLGEASGVAMANPPIDQAIPAIVFAVIGVLTLIQIPAMASALGGGVAISTLGAVAWMYGKAKSSMSAMRPTNLRRSFNQARSDVRIAATAAKAVAGAPMAVYRKITGGTRNRVARG